MPPHTNVVSCYALRTLLHTLGFRLSLIPLPGLDAISLRSCSLPRHSQYFFLISLPTFSFPVLPYYHGPLTSHLHRYVSAIGFLLSLAYAYNTRPPFRDRV